MIIVSLLCVVVVFFRFSPNGISFTNGDGLQSFSLIDILIMCLRINSLKKLGQGCVPVWLCRSVHSFNRFTYLQILSRLYLNILVEDVYQMDNVLLTFLHFAWIVSYVLQVNVLYLRKPCIVVEKHFNWGNLDNNGYTKK